MLAEQMVSSLRAVQALGVPVQSPLVQAHPRMKPQTVSDLAAAHVRALSPTQSPP
jgi:hypothetical protein